ncbi:MAG: TerB family tellurite resistance protein [Ramlibacter sp.]|nr:TerB family tellurite resistance protein [Ramlibacter sp.]
MLSTLKELFDAFTGPDDAHSPAAQDQALRLATAVLLVEVMRAEPSTAPSERDAVLAALREQFRLPDEALAQLVAQAEVESRRANDYFHFTSCINERLTQPQKIAMVEAMWRVAYADDHLDANENHVISKIAGLLHVTHGEYIGAKMRAKEAAGILPG